jgi:hypothetical protein
MTFELALSVISLALGCGGFVALLTSPDSQARRRLILATTFVIFVLVGLILFWQIWEREMLVRQVSRQILVELKSRKTADELVEGLYPNDPQVIYLALGRLAVAQQVKATIADVEDEKKLPHKVWLYSIP